MIKNYLKIAFRNLVKDKAYSFINITGLAAGMGVAVIIGLWMYDELSFNKNFDNYNRIAKVCQHLDNNGERVTMQNVPYPLAAELRSNYGSDFKHIVMVADWNDHILTVNGKKIKQPGGFFETEMPQMLSLQMEKGKAADFNNPSALFISSAAAKAFFGNEEPIGKTIAVDNMPPLTVAGVYRDLPDNSTFKNLHFAATWDFWYNANGRLSGMPDPWRSNFTQLLVQLNDHADIAAVNGRIKDARLKKVNTELQKKNPALFLHPMSQWHLYNEFKNGLNTGGAIQYVWMFGIIGMFVLLLACINFMNLSTARSEKRAKEVGIRKTAGSLRSQLVLQFFAESLFTVFAAFVLAICLAWALLPFFNSIAGKNILFPWKNIYFWILCAAFVLVTALLAGSYPAFYLSSFNPLKVLKGTFKAGRYASLPRKVLVTVQFTISVVLMVATIIVYRQIQFAKNRPAGYTRSELLTVPSGNGVLHKHFDAIKSDLLNTGAVTAVAEAESPTTGLWNTTSGFKWPGKDPNVSTDFGVVNTSVEYGATVNWELTEGRNFAAANKTDSTAVILNEAAARYMNLQHPVGTVVTWWDKPYTIIGVIKNMIIESPFDEQRPVIYALSEEGGSLAVLRLNKNKSAADAVAAIKQVFEKYGKDQPFEYSFTDDEYNKKFNAEAKAGSLAKIFTLLAIVISCLGLFGLTSFVAEQRKKEIGVRKVLGASVPAICKLISQEFMLLVLLSLFIAFPLAYYFMNNWLQHYSYRTTVSPWIFIVAGVSALLITLVTVSFQSVKAALANPVKSLRTE